MKMRGNAGTWAGVGILATFLIVIVAGVCQESLTVDEIVHATAGVTYWRFNDYRINPENGNLPQRLMGLPLLAGNYRFPAMDSEVWMNSMEWNLGDQWFNRMGNDMAGMLARGRATMALMAVAYAALVWTASRRIFGPTGGLLSLLVCVLNPTILANGALMNSGMTTSFFFLASVLALWAMLQRLSAFRLILSAMAVSGLFLSKMSAVLIVPMFVAMAVVRIVDSRPWPAGSGTGRLLATRSGRAAAAAAAFAALVLSVWVVMWAFYGFRYSMFAAGTSSGLDRVPISWDFVLDRTGPHVPLFGRLLEFIRERRLLPEAYVYGMAHAWRFSLERGAFLNGQFSMTGWRYFFPYTFLVKTPLALFGVIGFAAAAARSWRRVFWATVPLWVLLLIYWPAAILSHLNIGHRHIMDTYGPLFILCGAAAHWLEPGRPREARAALVGCLALLAAEAAFRFPAYLAYFNGIVSPAEGYRHLVDSSLDWGQDLPALQRYLKGLPPGEPTYLAYSGTAAPDYYGIHATLLGAFSGIDREDAHLRLLNLPADRAKAELPELMSRQTGADLAITDVEGKNLGVLIVRGPLRRGTYCISATKLQPATYGLDGPFGPWNARFERIYQDLLKDTGPVQNSASAERRAAIGRHSFEFWVDTYIKLEMFQFARLTAWLRQRQPANDINGSILIYHLSDDDVAQALRGPPPELGPDIPAEIKAR